jgi:hypothetical protein
MHQDYVRSGGQKMFLDCPAYLDQGGTRRCGLPAEVRCRFVLRSSDGPVEAATIRCPSGHWFNGPIEFLTRDREEKHHPGTAHVTPTAPCRVQDGPDGSPGRPVANSPTAKTGATAGGTRPGRGAATVPDHRATPRQETARPNTAPAYYLGRPASKWITALSPRRRRLSATGARQAARECAIGATAGQ